MFNANIFTTLPFPLQSEPRTSTITSAYKLPLENRNVIKTVKTCLAFHYPAQNLKWWTSASLACLHTVAECHVSQVEIRFEMLAAVFRAVLPFVCNSGGITHQRGQLPWRNLHTFPNIYIHTQFKILCLNRDNKLNNWDSNPGNSDVNPDKKRAFWVSTDTSEELPLPFLSFLLLICFLLVSLVNWMHKCNCVHTASRSSVTIYVII
jgi:hypothetical protein